METAILEIDTKPALFEGYQTTVHNGKHYVSVEVLCDIVTDTIKRVYEDDSI